MSFQKTPAEKRAILVQKKIYKQELIEKTFSIKEIHHLILLLLPLMDQTSFNSITKKWNTPLKIKNNDEFNLYTYIKQLLLCQSINFSGKTKARNLLTDQVYSLSGEDLDQPYNDVIQSLKDRKKGRSHLRIFT